MEYFLISIVALAGSALTFFSGFGLGTILMPVFALFFPVEVAIALTAVVHFLNNLFKLVLIGRKANWPTVLRFGLPSLVAAILGAWLLIYMSGEQQLYEYKIGTRSFSVTTVKLTMAAVLFFFAIYDLWPRLSSLQFPPRYMVLGGLLSGFFGGLSGNQGALRSAFLIRAGLSKEQFIATGVVIACLVDVSRLLLYTDKFLAGASSAHLTPVLCATVSAFAGAWIGARLVKKVTIKAVQITVGVMLMIFSVLLGAGIL